MTEAMGIDIGGTKVCLGVVTEQGSVLEEATVSTPKGDTQELLYCLDTQVQRLLNRHPTVESIGIGAAGAVNWEQGVIVWAPNNIYRNLDLRSRLVQRTGLFVAVDNDANVAAWAESQVGAGRGARNMLGVTVGTGVGSGLILNSQLYRGTSGLAGELGHIYVDPSPKVCGCGLSGCLEAVASGTALARTQRESQLHKSTAMINTATVGPLLLQRAQNGDQQAVSTLRNLGDYLGRALAAAVTLLDLDRIVMCGGLMALQDYFLDQTRASLNALVFSAKYRNLPQVVPGLLGPTAGMIGAALLSIHDRTSSRSAELSAVTVPEPSSLLS